MNVTLEHRLAGASGVLAAGGLLLASSARLAGAELAALALFPIFLAFLCGLVRPVRADRRWLASAALSSGVVAIALKLVSIVPLLARRNAPTGSPLDQALVRLEDFPVVISLYPLAVFCVVYGLLALSSRRMPRWIGAGAICTAAALAVNAAFLDSGFVPAFLLFIVWTLAVGAAVVFGAAAPETAVVDTADRRPVVPTPA